MSSVLSGLSETDQKELQTFMETEQARARVQQSTHQFTETCWDKCITGGVGARFGRGEEACLANCVGRFLDTSMFLLKKLEAQRNQV